MVRRSDPTIKDLEDSARYEIYSFPQNVAKLII